MGLFSMSINSGGLYITIMNVTLGNKQMSYWNQKYLYIINSPCRMNTTIPFKIYLKETTTVLAIFKVLYACLFIHIYKYTRCTTMNGDTVDASFFIYTCIPFIIYSMCLD